MKKKEVMDASDIEFKLRDNPNVKAYLKANNICVAEYQHLEFASDELELYKEVGGLRYWFIKPTMRFQITADGRWSYSKRGWDYQYERIEKDGKKSKWRGCLCLCKYTKKDIKRILDNEIRKSKENQK